MTAPVVEVSGLAKRFGRFTALNEVNLDVSQDEVHGFLGPNGAGKSTTIRILLGLLRRDAGRVRLWDSDPWKDAVELHRRLAYVPGDVNLWPNLSGGEAVDLFGALRGGIDPERRDAMIRRFKLDPTKKCRTYSKGNRQKVAIIAAFASRAELLILDEPTAGLDPLMDTIFRECVGELQQQGCTVLLSSHSLPEVEALCDRVSIIREGTIVESGTLAELRHLARTSLTVQTRDPMQHLDQVEGVHDVDISGNTARFQVDPDFLPEVHAFLARHHVLALTSSPPSLEQLFLRHYEDDLGMAQARSASRSGEAQR